MDRGSKFVRIWLVAIVPAVLLLTGCARSTPGPSPTLSPKPAPSPKVATSPAAAPKPAGLPKALIFASPPIGTATYIVVSGLASVIEKYTGMKAIVQPMTSNSLVVSEMEAGRADMTVFALAAQYAIFRGEEEYKQLGPKPIRPLGSGHGNAYVWVTRPDTGIKSVPDMVGKKVSYISAVSPPLTTTFRLVLEHYGVAEKVVALPRASMDAAARALIEKRVDVIGGPYGAFAYEVQQATGIVVIPIGKKEVDYISEKRADLAAVIAKYPAGYFGLKEEMVTASGILAMVVTSRMPDAVANAIVRAVYDHPEDTKAIHRDVGEYTLDRALQFGFVAPMHPAAIKYYQEKGMWTKEHEALQQKLLALDKELAARKK